MAPGAEPVGAGGGDGKRGRNHHSLNKIDLNASDLLRQPRKNTYKNIMYSEFFKQNKNRCLQTTERGFHCAYLQSDPDNNLVKKRHVFFPAIFFSY